MCFTCGTWSGGGQVDSIESGALKLHHHEVFGRAAICDEVMSWLHLAFSQGAVVVRLVFEYVMIQADVDMMDCDVCSFLAVHS